MNARAKGILSIGAACVAQGCAQVCPTDAPAGVTTASLQARYAHGTNCAAAYDVVARALLNGGGRGDPGGTAAMEYGGTLMAGELLGKTPPEVAQDVAAAGRTTDVLAAIQESTQGRRIGSRLMAMCQGLMNFG